MPVEELASTGESRAWIARGFMALGGLFTLLRARVNAQSKQNERLWDEINDLKNRVGENEEQIAYDTARTEGQQELLKELAGTVKTVMVENNEQAKSLGTEPKYTAEDWDYTERFIQIDRQAEAASRHVRRMREDRENRRRRSLSSRESDRRSDNG